MSDALLPEDRALLVAWLDGELATEERQRLELRLAAEPELARAAEALAPIDDALRRPSPRVARLHRQARARTARRMLLAGAFLAACALLVFRLASRREPPFAFEVAIVPSFETARAFADRMPELRGLRAPGLDEVRGNGEQPNVGAEEFLRRAGSALGDLARDPRLDSAGFFVLPLTLPAGAPTADVVVIAVPETGPEQLLWPAEGAAPGPLEPGRHWLPEEPFSAARDSEGETVVRYARGFLVPVGCRSLAVLVGVRAAGADSSTLVIRLRQMLAPVDATGEEGARARWRKALENAGFNVRELRVHEL